MKNSRNFQKIKNFLFFSTSTFLVAQQPIQITRFNPTVISISVGSYSLGVERCNIFLNSPGAGQVQIACYFPNNPIPVKNEIDTIPQLGFSGSWTFPDVTMTWDFKPGEYHFAAGNPNQTNEAKGDGTF